MRSFASTLVKFSKLSHIQTTIWRPPKTAPPCTAGSAGPFITPLAGSGLEKITGTRIKLGTGIQPGLSRDLDLASDLVLWEPMHGRSQQGRQRQNYLSMLLKEVGTNSKEKLQTLMRNRDIWRGVI